MTTENQHLSPIKESFFKLNTKKVCQQAITAGWITALVSCGFTALLALVFIPMLFIDALLIAIMAYFIYKKSRIASTIMVIYFIASKLLILQEGDCDGGIALQLVFSLLFTLIYIQAMRATYVWHANYASKTVKPDNDGNNTLVG